MLSDVIDGYSLAEAMNSLSCKCGSTISVFRCQLPTSVHLKAGGRRSTTNLVRLVTAQGNRIVCSISCAL